MCHFIHLLSLLSNINLNYIRNVKKGAGGKVPESYEDLEPLLHYTGLPSRGGKFPKTYEKENLAPLKKYAVENLGRVLTHASDSFLAPA
jgi:hypothetical protein